MCVKNPDTLQLLDSLQAQSDSRNKHDDFHNQLNRSMEPFSVVAKFLGYGLFNRIVIVEENEAEDVRICSRYTVNHFITIHHLQINRNVQESAKASKNALPASVPFGPGAEATIRVKESQHMRQEEAIKRAPIPEARMRLHEVSSNKPSIVPTSGTSSSFKAPRKQPALVKVTPKTYDPAKDPFAEDENAAAFDDAPKKVSDVASNNPFENPEDDHEEADRKALDSNLNPFE